MRHYYESNHGTQKTMTGICNFPIDQNKRCTQPIADGRPNCGRHKVSLSAEQLEEDLTVYKKGGQLHIWAGEPDDVYCMIHSDPAYQALYQVAGETPPCCLKEMVEYRDEDGQWHRDDGPAVIESNGSQWWFRHGQLHRDDGPAMIHSVGRLEWCQYGECHRDGGPARIYVDGTREWYQHGKLHRDDGPAVIYADGVKEWYQHGDLHRDDGPARIWPDGSQQWYWHDEEVTEEEHAKLREQSEGV